jgi:ABC-2 type transport system permease protein
VSARTTFATARRVLLQILRDHRTVALLILVPVVLMVILRGMFDAQPGLFDQIGAPLLGLFPLITMFLVTSIAMLRERTTGTLERLLSMPVAKLDVLVGYAIAFAAAALVQIAVVAAVSFGLLGLDSARAPVWVAAIGLLNALLGVCFGLFVSAFARTEFQAVQFMPAFVFPQLLLCGLFVPRDQMAGVLEAISYALPLTYAYDALARVASPDALGARFWVDVGVTAAAALLGLALGAATLRRRTD